jgi:hypothetical protein
MDLSIILIRDSVCGYNEEACPNSDGRESGITWLVSSSCSILSNMQTSINFKVGGGLAVGYSILETAHKEAFEEASIPEEILRNLEPAGSVRQVSILKFI